MKSSAPQGNAGLPMTSKWDPEKLQRELAELQALESQPFLTRAAGYLERTGPGLLQSAMTLGAGSVVASVVRARRSGINSCGCSRWRCFLAFACWRCWAT